MEKLALYPVEIQIHPEQRRLQAEDDAVTQFAEIVDGQMRSTFELQFTGHDLVGRDGRGVDKLTQDGLTLARQEAKDNPNLWFEVGRRSHEREEFKELLDMAAGNGSNTMVVTSEFPSALKESTEDIGGYNVTRQQTMVRVYTRLPNGNIMMHSQTLDGSDRDSLEAIHQAFGHETDDGVELLGQRISAELPVDQQANLVDRIVGIYDRQMSDKFGGVWYAGRRPADYRNTYNFVQRQTDLVEACVEHVLDGTLTDQLMYNMAATMQARFDSEEARQYTANPKVDILTEMVTRINYDSRGLQYEIRMAGQNARSRGMTFSGCGETLRADGSGDSADTAITEAGFGSKMGETKSWHGGKRYFNKKCVSCEEVKPEVGACHICKDCVDHPKNKKKK